MSARMTYNGINLGLIKTVRVEQSGKYDPSNTDMLYVNNRFLIRSIISIVSGSPLSPSMAPETNPAETMARVRHELLLPRRDFLYEFSSGGAFVKLLEAGPNTDSNNGPKPIDCSVTQVTDKTWIIDYTIDVATRDCAGAGEANFASNRYEVSHDIDHKGYSTITTTGKVIVRSDMKRSPDSLRHIITPPVLKGFRRSSFYSLQEDGLSMNYKFVDKELYEMPPAVAVEASGKFSIVAVPPGAVMHAQVDIRLEGGKTAGKKTLMEMAILMALRRLEAGGVVLGEDNRPFVMGGAISEELFEGVVEVQLKGRIRAPNAIAVPNERQQFFSGFWKGFLRGALWDIGPWAAKWANGDNRGIDDARKKAGQTAADIAGRAGNAAAAGANPPQAMGATFIGGLVDRIGVPVVGADQQASFIDPGLRGNIDFFHMVAAAFRDPCVAEAIREQMTNSLKSVKAQPGGAPAGGGPGNVGGKAIQKPNRIGDKSKKKVQASFSQEETSIRSSMGGKDASSNPALDWRIGRLVNLSGDTSGVVFNQVRVLMEVGRSVPASDEYPGWYETHYAEIEHDTDMNQCVLPASMPGVAGSLCRWASPLRTITIRWAIEKAGFPPEIPIILNDSSIVVLKHKMNLPEMTYAADAQTPVFSTTGETVYQKLDTKNDDIHYMVPPWLRQDMRGTPCPIPSPTVIVSKDVSTASQPSLNSSQTGGQSTIHTPNA